VCELYIFAYRKESKYVLCIQYFASIQSENSKTIEDTPLVSCLNSKRNNNTVVFKKSTPIL
jgi:hypothetical protein